MRYARLFDTLWTDPAYRELSNLGKLAYCYVCSCTHCNAIGYFRLPVAYMADDMGVTPAQAKEALGELHNGNFVSYNAKTSRMLVRSYLKWNPPQSSNNLKPMAEVFDSLVPDDLDGEFVAQADETCSELGLALFSSLSKRGKAMVSQAKETVQEDADSATGRAIPSAGMTPPQEAIEPSGRAIPSAGISQNTGCRIQDAGITPLVSPQGATDGQAQGQTPSTPSPKKPSATEVREARLLARVPSGYREAFGRFMADRRSRGKAMTEQAVTLTVAKLDSALKSDADRVGCIEQSIANGWTGVFPDAFLRDRAKGKARLVSGGTLPDSVVHTEEAWAGKAGGKLRMGGQA